MDMLSQLEVDMLKRTASSDLYQLFRNCSLAVLNSGSLTDNSKELLSRFENFGVSIPHILSGKFADGAKFFLVKICIG